MVFFAFLLFLAADPIRENIEWLDVWMPNTNDHALPRVLLIGDSITRGYGKQVEVNLKGKAYVARMATSKSLGDPALLEQVTLVLREQSFHLIHFNNGLHGDGYSEEAYAAAFPELLSTLRRLAPKARLIWASSTDAPKKTDRILHRNQLAAAIATREHIPIDDLASLVRDHPEYHGADGVHFTEEGYAVLAKQVAAEIVKLLP